VLFNEWLQEAAKLLLQADRQPSGIAKTELQDYEQSRTARNETVTTNRVVKGPSAASILVVMGSLWHRSNKAV